MRPLVYGVMADIHAHNWRVFSSTNEQGINTRLQDILHEIERCARMVAKKRGNTVYIAGDVFHARGVLKPTILNAVIDCLSECVSKYGVRFRIIPGNHDLEGKETSALSSAVQSLQNSSGSIEVFNEPVFFAPHFVAMVPWHNTREGLLSAIDDLRQSLLDAGEEVFNYTLMLHTGISGVITGADEHAFSPRELAELGFQRVMCGHYHKHMTFKIPVDMSDVEVISIGAPTHHNWGDVGAGAGFMLLEDDEAKFFETDAPMFVDFDASADIDPDRYMGHFVRIRDLDLDRDEIEKLRSAILEAGAREVVVHLAPKSSVVEREDGAVVAGVVPKNEDVIDKWVDHAGFDDEIAGAVKSRALETLRESAE